MFTNYSLDHIEAVRPCIEPSSSYITLNPTLENYPYSTLIEALIDPCKEP